MSWNIIFYFLGITPWVFITSLMAFHIEAGKILGRPPSYDQPDPKDLSIYQDYFPFIDLSFAIWLWSFVIWLALIMAYLIIKRKDRRWTPIIISAIGQFFGILFLFSGIFEWYVD